MKIPYNDADRYIGRIKTSVGYNESTCKREFMNGAMVAIAVVKEKEREHEMPKR